MFPNKILENENEVPPPLYVLVMIKCCGHEDTRISNYLLSSYVLRSYQIIAIFGSIILSVYGNVRPKCFTNLWGAAKEPA